MGSISEGPTSSSSTYGREIDPLLKDLSEKRQNFKKNIVSLAAELKEVRTWMALKEQSYVKETLTRKEAEAKAKAMEEEVCRLHRSLEERNEQLHASASNSEKYLQELDDLRSQLTITQATADASAASAQSAQLQYLALLKDLDEKNNSIREHEDHVQRLAEQLDILQKDLQMKEFSQKQLKDEVLRLECDIMEAMAKNEVNEDRELRKILDDISSKNWDNMNKLLSAKGDEISKLRDEIRILSTHYQLKIKELETQMEMHRKADQDLKKRVLKLEFCLQESRSQTRKLQRMGEQRDKTIKELRDQLAEKQQVTVKSDDKQNFWESSNFKILVSISMLALLVFTRR